MSVEFSEPLDWYGGVKYMYLMVYDVINDSWKMGGRRDSLLLLAWILLAKTAHLGCFHFKHLFFVSREEKKCVYTGLRC